MLRLLNKALSSLGFRLIRLEDEPREVVYAFSLEMEGELIANDYKGRGWTTASAFCISRHLYKKAGQLVSALYAEPASPVSVRKEAADLANYAMFAADNFGELRGAR